MMDEKGWPQDMVEQLQSIDPWQAIAIIAVLIALVVGFDKFLAAAEGLKHRLIDRKTNKIIDAALEGSDSLREEIMRRFDESLTEHDEFRSDITEIREMLDRDKRALMRMDDDIDRLRVRVDGVDTRLDRNERHIDAINDEMRIMLASIKTILNEKIGVAGTTDIVDTVKQIDEFLIERKEVV